MFNDDNTSISEWNEQMLYARIFFAISLKCREAQSLENYKLWKNLVLSKIIHIYPICSPDEQKKLLQSRTAINTIYARYEKTTNVKYKNHKEQSRALTDMYNNIFDIETSIDTCANSHMPFLRLKEEFTEEDI